MKLERRGFLKAIGGTVFASLFGKVKVPGLKKHSRIIGVGAIDGLLVCLSVEGDRFQIATTENLSEFTIVYDSLTNTDIPVHESPPVEIVVTGRQRWIVGCYDGRVFMTHDEGSSWQEIVHSTIPPSFFQYDEVWFP